MNKKGVITSREGKRETHTDDIFSFNHKMPPSAASALWAAGVTLPSSPAAPTGPERERLGQLLLGEKRLSRAATLLPLLEISQPLP